MSISSSKQAWKIYEDFRILLVYPNIQQAALMPYSMGLFTALLRREGFQVDLFDATFYLDEVTANYPHYRTFVREFDWAERGVRFKEGVMIEDFKRKVDDFQPDLIAISVVENTYPIGRLMIRSLPSKHHCIPVIWGGVFATFAPQMIFKDQVGDFVCRGEGEVALIELCKRMCAGGPLTDIPNVWARQDGNIYRNTLGPRVNLEELPFPDYSLFEEQAIYRPMQGKLWRTIGVESQRGCPFQCTYCNSPAQNRIAREEQGSIFYRKKSTKRVMEEIAYLRQRHNIELIYWLVDTFLAISTREFDELVEMYDDFRIPFWMNTRTETMSEHAADGLERMNMLRMSFGIEHGNAEYRRKMLKRDNSNEQMLRAFQICSGRNFVTTGNCIIGMPDETRELIFETIEFTRQLPKDIEAQGAFVFAPYHGTELRRIAVAKGYLDRDSICDILDPTASMLDQPQLTRQEVIGLAKTFGLYQLTPKSEWDQVRVAEQDTAEGNGMFTDLVARFPITDVRGRLDEGAFPIE